MQTKRERTEMISLRLGIKIAQVLKQREVFIHGIQP